MEKPNIYEAYQKSVDVILSCKTWKQLENAGNYMNLFDKLYNDFEFSMSLNDYYWEKYSEMSLQKET